MTERRTRSSTGPDRAAAIAEQLLHECSILMELYRKKVDFAADLPELRLVTIPPPSSQLDTTDGLVCLHFTLLQCHRLLERAIATEEEELGSGNKGEYEKMRTTVKERLSILLISTGGLLKAAGHGSIITPDGEVYTLNTLFGLKVWVYQVFKEVDYWTKTAINSLRDAPITTQRGRINNTWKINDFYSRRRNKH